MRTAHWLALGLFALACGGQVETDGTGGTASGGTGGATGGSGGTGGSPSCDQIQGEFASALTQAKQCDPLVDEPQCTLSFHSGVACGCPTFVNPGNTAALAQLKQIEVEWQSAGCVQPCPASCPAPQGAGCEKGGAGGDSGICQDFF
jgi:hypothetical protein